MNLTCRMESSQNFTSSKQTIKDETIHNFENLRSFFDYHLIDVNQGYYRKQNFHYSNYKHLNFLLTNLIIRALTSFNEGMSRSDNGADEDAAEILSFSSSSLAWCDLGNTLCASKKSRECLR